MPESEDAFGLRAYDDAAAPMSVTDSVDGMFRGLDLLSILGPALRDEEFEENVCIYAPKEWAHVSI